MSEDDDFLDEYIREHKHGEDNQLYARTARLMAGRIKALSNSISNLQASIAHDTGVIEFALRTNTEKMIDSNKKLADSNEKHAKAMIYFTFALVLIGVLQVLVSWVKG